MSAPPKNACAVCGQTFTKPAGSAFDICPSCMAKMEKRYAGGDGKGAPAAPKKKTAYLWVLLAASVAVNLWQAPQAKKALGLLFPPAAQGWSKQGNPADQCLSNLWNVSALIQKGQWPSGTLTCPSSGAPYETRKTAKGDVVVSCPNPAAHGLKALRVSRDFPTPESE